MDIGDIVVYNGKRIIIDYFIWDDLYNLLEIGGEYRVLDINSSIKGPPGKLYISLNIKLKGYGEREVWFPKDCFYIDYGKKYGLI